MSQNYFLPVQICDPVSVKSPPPLEFLWKQSYGSELLLLRFKEVRKQLLGDELR